MKVIHKLAMVAAVLVAVTWLASPAAAQGSYVTFKGKFTLSNEVRWGRTVLPAGEYSMTISSGSSQPDFITLRGKEKTAVVLVGQTSKCDSCRNSELVVVRSGGQRAIRALELPGSRSLFYHAKPDASAELGANPPATERIRIASNQ